MRLTEALGSYNVAAQLHYMLHSRYAHNIACDDMQNTRGLISRNTAYDFVEEQVNAEHCTRVTSIIVWLRNLLTKSV